MRRKITVLSLIGMLVISCQIFVPGLQTRKAATAQIQAFEAPNHNG